MNETDKLWNDWLATRPASIQKAARAFPPGIYRLRLSNENTTPIEYSLIGYTEPETDDKPPTVILETSGALGLVPRTVYGVELHDLVPIDVFKPREA